MPERLFTITVLLVLICGTSAGEESSAKPVNGQNDQAKLVRDVEDGMNKEIMDNRDRDLQNEKFLDLLKNVIEKIKPHVHDPDGSKTKEIINKLRRNQKIRQIFLKGLFVKVILSTGTLDKLREFMQTEIEIVNKLAARKSIRLQETAAAHVPESVVAYIPDMLFEYIKRHQKGFGNQKTKSILSDIYNELKNDHHNVELIDAIKNLETNFTALMAEKGKKEMDKSSVKTFDVHGGIAKRRGESSAQKEEDQPNDQSIEAELMRIVDGMDKEMTSHDLQIKNFQQLLHKVIEKIKEDVHEPDSSKIKKIRKELSKDQRFREIYLKGQLVRVIMESSPEILSKFLDEKKVIVYQIALANAYKNRGGRRRVVHLPETVMEAIQDMVFAHVKQEQWFKDEIKVKDILKKHTVEQLSQENQEVSTAMDKLEKNFSVWMDANAEKGMKESAGKRKLPQTPEIDTYNSFDIKDQKDADAPPQPSKRRRESATGEISSSTHKKLFYGTQGLEEDH